MKMFCFKLFLSSRGSNVKPGGKIMSDELVTVPARLLLLLDIQFVNMEVVMGPSKVEPVTSE
jgi:hypothetical protein